MKNLEFIIISNLTWIFTWILIILVIVLLSYFIGTVINIVYKIGDLIVNLLKSKKQPIINKLKVKKNHFHNSIQRSYTTIVDNPKGIIWGLFNWYKINKKELQWTKLIIILIVNTWLLILFWKIFLIEGVNITENNVILKKMETVIKPALIYLGIDILTPSTIKLLIASLVIITANVGILYFNTILIVCIPLGIARYGYKMYTNYLINKENILNTEVLTPKIIPQKIAEHAPIIINTGNEAGTNWWLWGTVIVVGCIAIGALGFAFWSHQTTNTNIVSISESQLTYSRGLNNTINHVDEKTAHINNQVDLLFKNHGKAIDILKEKDDLLNLKITNLETGFEEFGSKITLLEEKNVENMKLLSGETLKITQEAKSFFGEVLDASSASEAITLAVAKLYDGFEVLSEKVNTVEAKVDSITGTTQANIISPRNTFLTNITRTKLNKDDI